MSQVINKRHCTSVIPIYSDQMYGMWDLMMFHDIIHIHQLVSATISQPLGTFWWASWIVGVLDAAVMSASWHAHLHLAENDNKLPGFYTPTDNSELCPPHLWNDPQWLVRCQLDQPHVQTLAIITVWTWRLSAVKKQQFIDGTRVVLDITKESADACSPLKSCLGGISMFIKYYDVR